MRLNLFRLLLLLSAPTRLHAQADASLRGACFTFAYVAEAPESDSTSFAKQVRFDKQSGSHQLKSTGFPDDSIHFWRMFENGATWAQISLDSIQLNFSNGFSSVSYDLGLHGDSLAGTASILFDFRTGDSMPRAHAIGRRCR
jgi:hypothetical protein